VLVNLDLMSRPLSVDAKTLSAEFEAGIRLRDIGPFLQTMDLAMENLGAITDQSLAGAIGSGTHGTGLSYGILGTQMAGCTLVDGTGEIRSFHEASHPKEMRALRLNLGVLGVLCSVTLKCVKAHMVELCQFRLSFKEAMDTYDNLSANERCRIYWFPGTDEVFVNTMNRTAKADSPGPVFSWIEAQLLRKRLMGFLWSAGRQWPEFVDELNQFQVAVGFTDKDPIVGPSFEAITTPMPPLHRECEFAIPLEAGPEVLRELDKRIRKDGLQINVPSEIRFVRADDAFISPSYKTEVCYLGAYTASDRDEQRYFDIFGEVMSQVDGRAHWGKIGAPDRATAQRWYPEMSGFEAVRERLDPDGVFLNSYLAEVFGK
jgi:FAD/FMN-containing dehydrogenase